MKKGEEVAPFDCTIYSVFPIDFFVVLAVVVPSRRQQTLIINMFRQKQETSVLIRYISQSSAYQVLYAPACC